jgi:hypothetical protein
MEIHSMLLLLILKLRYGTGCTNLEIVFRSKPAVPKDTTEHFSFHGKSGLKANQTFPTSFSRCATVLMLLLLLPLTPLNKQWDEF